MRGKLNSALAAALRRLRKGAGEATRAGELSPSADTPTRIIQLRALPSAIAGTPERDRLWLAAAAHNAHGIAIVEPASATLRAVNAAYAQLVGRTPAQLEGQPANSA
jgi:hypothetical protein